MINVVGMGFSIGAMPVFSELFNWVQRRKRSSGTRFVATAATIADR